MADTKYKKVPISDELRETAACWIDLLEEIAGDFKFRMEPFSARFDVLEITAENFERFQAAFQEADVTNDDVDRLQFLLMRFEKDTGERETNFEHWSIAYSVSKLIKNKGQNPDMAYENVADEVGLDKSSVGKIYRAFSRS